MAARATASGSIVFGMVSVPVKLYTATDSKKFSFRLLSPNGQPVKQKYVDGNGDIVERADMLKGYEISKGRFVTFTKEELKALESTNDDSIRVTEFVPFSQIDAVYLDKAYYLAPERGSERAYHLLAEAMRRTGRCALAKHAARGKQHIVVLRPGPDGIILQRLMYAHEVRSFSDVGVQPCEISDAELDLATKIVESHSTDAFEPGKYRDEVCDRIQALIDKKVSGDEISVTNEAPRSQTIDLMAALQASLLEAPPQRATKPRKGPKTARKRAGKKRKSA